MHLYGGRDRDACHTSNVVRDEIQPSHDVHASRATSWVLSDQDWARLARNNCTSGSNVTTESCIMQFAKQLAISDNLQPRDVSGPARPDRVVEQVLQHDLVRTLTRANFETEILHSRHDTFVLTYNIPRLIQECRRARGDFFYWWSSCIRERMVQFELAANHFNTSNMNGVHFYTFDVQRNVLPSQYFANAHFMHGERFDAHDASVGLWYFAGGIARTHALPFVASFRDIMTVTDDDSKMFMQLLLAYSGNDYGATPMFQSMRTRPNITSCCSLRASNAAKEKPDENAVASRSPEQPTPEAIHPLMDSVETMRQFDGVDLDDL